MFEQRYELQSSLGSGGMGVVYRALDRLTGEHVALKQVKVSDTTLETYITNTRSVTEEARLGLALEFRTLSSLRHPHIISVLDYGFTDEKAPYFTMTLLEEADTLTRYAAQTSRTDKIRLLTELLQALAYLHRRGILHRDIKPDNILVDAAGNVQVMDFGLALTRSDAAQLDDDDRIYGTMSYMAPELFGSHPASVQSDLYAVGMIACEVLAGRYPFEFDNASDLIMKMMNTMPDVSQFDESLQAWLNQMLSKNPADRYADATTALNALLKATDTPQTGTPAQLRESYLQASRFVGRRREMNRLLDAYQQVQDKNAVAVWLIGGESGAGKSRLLDELRSNVLVQGALVLRGQGVTGGGLPFQLWRTIVRPLVLVSELSDMQVAVLKDIVPDIEALLGRSVDPAPELIGAAYNKRLMDAILAMFRAQKRPVVILLEDLQWAIESLEPIQAILQEPESLQSLLVVGTYRTEERPALPDELPGAESLVLERLDKDEIAELSASMLGEVDENVVELLQRETAGNAFFMVEVVRVMAEEAGDLDEVGFMTLPPSIITQKMDDILQRRLARMPAEYQPLLHLAAVAGRQIDRDVLRQARPAADIDGWLYTAESLAVLSMQENQWKFAHDKLRETLLSRMDEADRQPLHADIAAAIEAVYPDDDAFADVLIDHWHRAGNVDKVLPHLLTFGERLVDLTAEYSRARTLLQRTLSNLPDGDKRRIDLLNLLARADIRAGHFSEAQTSADEAQRLSETFDDIPGIAAGYYNKAVINMRLGNAEPALRDAKKSLELRRKLNNEKHIAASLTAVGHVYIGAGDYQKAQPFYEETLEIVRRLNDERNIANSINNLGNVQMGLGDIEAARTHFENSLKIQRRIGNQQGVLVGVMNLGSIADERKQYDEAARYFEEGVQIGQDTGNRYMLAAAQASLGLLRASQNHPDAPALLKNALHTGRPTGAAPLLMQIALGFAVWHLVRDDYEAAARILGALQALPVVDSDVERQRKTWHDTLLEAMTSADDDNKTTLQHALKAGAALSLDELLDSLA